MPVIFAYNNNAGTLRHWWHHIYTPYTPIDTGYTDQPAQSNVTSKPAKATAVSGKVSFSFSFSV